MFRNFLLLLFIVTTFGLLGVTGYQYNELDERKNSEIRLAKVNLQAWEAGYKYGKESIEKEAVDFGYARYRLEKGTNRPQFEWLPAIVINEELMKHFQELKGNPLKGPTESPTQEPKQDEGT